MTFEDIPQNNNQERMKNMKKLLSILLTTAMLVSVFAISASAFVPTVDNNIKDVVQNFDGTDEVNFTTPINSDFSAVKVQDGAATVETWNNSAMGYSSGILSTTQPTTTNYTLQFDITRNQDITYQTVTTDAETGEEVTETVTITENPYHKLLLSIMLPRNAYHAALGGFGLWLPMDGMETGKARTFSIIVDEAVAANATANQVEKATAAGAVTVFAEVKYMDEGDTEWTYPTRSNTAATYGYRVLAGESAVKNTADAGGVSKYADLASALNAYSEGIALSTRNIAGDLTTTEGRAYRDKSYTYDNISITSHGYNYPVVEGVQYTRDFENADSEYTASNTLVVKESTESNGNKFYRLSVNDSFTTRAEMNGASWLATYTTSTAEGTNVYPGSVVTIDVRYITKGMPLTLMIAKNADYYEDANPGKRPMALGLFPRELNKWYTYKVEFGNFTKSEDINSYMTVYVKERGADDSTYTKLSGVDMGGLDTLVWNNPEKTFDMDKYGFGYKNGWTSPDNGKTVHIGYNSYTLQDASWTTEVLRGTVTDVDNLQIRDKVAFSGDNATVADGVLSSKLFVETAEEAPTTAIVAVYDKADGRLADVSFDAINGGSDNYAENAVDFDAETQDALLFFWSDLSSSATPLCAPYTGLVAE